MLDGLVTRDLMMEQVFVFYAEKGVRRSIEYVEIEFTFAISIQSLNIKSVILSPIFVKLLSATTIPLTFRMNFRRALNNIAGQSSIS